MPFEANVAELVDAHDSKSCSFGSVGSNPTRNVMGETEQTQGTDRTDMQRIFEKYDEVWIGIA